MTMILLGSIAAEKQLCFVTALHNEVLVGYTVFSMTVCKSVILSFHQHLDIFAEYAK